MKSKGLYLDLSRPLTRDGIAVALSMTGYPVTAGELAKLAVKGTGPAYSLIRVAGGWRALYDYPQALAWAEAQPKVRRGPRPMARAA